MPEPPRRRAWFQFNLGTMLWLMLVFGMLLTWWLDRQRLEERLLTLEGKRYNPQTNTLWSAKEALGQPDDPTGQAGKSWCPAGTGGQEWIELSFDRDVTASSIETYETYQLGSVTQVSVFDYTGEETILWQGTDPTSPASAPAGTAAAVFSVPVGNKLTVSRVKIALDGTKIPGWNCVDAVGLKSANGRTEWATAVTASSGYGNSPTTASKGSWWKVW